MPVYEELNEMECKMVFKVDDRLDPGIGMEYANTGATSPISVGAVSRLFNNANSNQLVRLTYRVGSWPDVSVIWPKGWPPPGLNRLGWLPKCEFGTGGKANYFNEPPSSLITIPHFAYRDIKGDLVHG